MLKGLVTKILKEEILVSVEKDRTKETNLSSRFFGRVCMVRTYSAGVHFGELVEKIGQEAILKDSRRVFYWSHACSLSQLAMEGSKKIGDCKIAMSVNEILLDRVIEVIPMTEEAILNLSESKIWKK